MCVMLAGMSEKSNFKIFYGEGEIRYCSEGVDLSGFHSVDKGISRANERSFGAIYNWLIKCFKLNPDQYGLTISAVTSRSRTPIYWELMPIGGSSIWRRFVEVSTQRGFPLMLFIQAYKKVGGSSEVNEQAESEVRVNEATEDDNDDIEERVEVDTTGENVEAAIEATGQIDEGESIPGLVEQMEHEDAEADGLEDNECDEDDDEDEYSVPSQWSNYDHSLITVNEGESVHWDYSVNEVTVGAMYRSGDEVKEAVQRWSTLCLQREFRVNKSSPSVYDVKCVHHDCPFRVHAYKGKYDTFWTVSRIEQHTCVLEELRIQHRNLTATFVAQHVYSKVVENPGYEPKSIVRIIEDDFKYTISYSKAFRAKQKALQMRWGTYEASYHNLPRLLDTLCRRNLNSYYEIKHYNLPQQSNIRVLQRAFFALGACIHAFKHCRPVICIDGTFLTGRYKGTILTAVAADGNNQIVPLAIAFVESENGDSWYWFLERLKLCIVQDRIDVCVIHDRHKGILQAVGDLKDGSTERGRPPRWVDLKSRWCMRHMGANFQSQFKNRALTKLFKRLCMQNQERKFNALWRKLDELTKKQATELSKKAVNSEDQAPVSLANVGLDGPHVRRKSGRSIKSFSEWIEHEPIEKWALLKDEGGARYGIMTTNLAEVYNWVIRGIRSMPLVGIIEFFVYRTTEYFRDRFAAAQKVVLDSRMTYGQKLHEYMIEAIKKAGGHRVRNMGVVERRYEVLCRDKGRRGGNREIHLQEVVLTNTGCVCSCCKPKLYHRPCTHVIAACAEAGGLNVHMFVSPYYMKECIMETWRHEIYGFAIAGSFTESPIGYAEFVPNPHPDARQKIGRRKTRRIRNNMDEAEAGPRVVICSKCNGIGHSYKKCTFIATGTISSTTWQPQASSHTEHGS